MAVKSTSKGTSTELGSERITATDAEAAAFDLQPHLVSLMWDEPFYSRVLRGITKVRSEDLPTAGVAVKDGNVRFYWNPKFCATLLKEGGAKKIKGLNKHECLHLIFDHCVGRKHDPHIIWNYSTDCAINSLIDEDELPECGIIPGNAFTELTEEQQLKMGPERVAKYEQLSAFIEALPKGLASEEYFARFMANKDIVDTITGEQERGQPGEGEPGEGQPGDGPGIPGPMDDHDGWGEMSDEDREMVKNQIKQAVKEAAQECDSKGQWGSVSGEMRGIIRSMLSNEIPWQSVLKKFVGYTRRANRSTGWNRIHSSYGPITPGARRSYTSNIAIYIDQSGSVSEAELALGFGELANLAKKTEFTTFHFDTEVDEDSEMVWKKKGMPAHRTRCGGTDFNCVAKHFAKNKHRFDGYIIFTDGFASDPGKTRFRRGWIITTDGAVQEWMGSPDFIIKMKQPAKAAA
jgi:predicted metal-dependent peptidase